LAELASAGAVPSVGEPADPGTDISSDELFQKMMNSIEQTLDKIEQILDKKGS
jgi:hypothetical protein